ncbi:MAG: cell division protein FtsI (penicillin-binding protein 3) [Cyclobacteriaceae bacterium]|jgi:cell division protein FtsI (penicillin-binding protein 3)
MNIKTSILLRVRIAYLAVLLFSFAIIYKIVIIQTVDGDKWIAKSEVNSLKYRTVKATRGNIYSDNGSLLATSLPFYKVAIDPSRANKDVYRTGVDELSKKLSNYFNDRSAKEYKRRINDARRSGREYLSLNRSEINYQAKKMMLSWPIFKEGRMKGGIIFEKVDQRYKPFSHLGDRTIGSLTQDKSRGTVGLEYSFNRELSGRNGEALFQKFSGGNWKQIYEEVKPKNGYDVQTTINVDLQDVAESALLGALIANDADYGSVVVMEVNTGEIKAISNLSKNKKGGYWELYNNAVAHQGSREPGSTFKLASMIALFENSNVKLTDSVNTGNGKFDFYDQTMEDHRPGGYGMLSVKQVFEKSSNIGTAKLVTEQFGANPMTFYNALEDMGLTRPLGFQMIGEGEPYIKHPKKDTTWSGTTLPWMAHGYELQLTPLHTLTLFNAVANNGKMIQPIIVRQIKKADQIIENFESKTINKRICSPATLSKVREMLEGVVERGTAKNISDSHYKIAGKTGTAKKLENGKYTNKYYTSFAGYFPAEKPRYSCIVVIDNPKSYRIYGGDLAAPVFKEVADKIYALDLEMHKPYEPKDAVAGVFPVIQSGESGDLKMICNEIGISNHANQESKWAKARIANNSIAWRSIDSGKNLVPDVKGMTLRDALYILENKSLKVKYSGSGRVQEQSLLPGSSLKAMNTIEIKLG